jgi:hypothetical protein
MSFEVTCLCSIEHLICEEMPSDIMANGSSAVFVEREGVIQPVPDVCIGWKNL